MGTMGERDVEPHRSPVGPYQAGGYQRQLLESSADIEIKLTLPEVSKARVIVSSAGLT